MKKYLLACALGFSSAMMTSSLAFSMELSSDVSVNISRESLKSYSENKEMSSLLGAEISLFGDSVSVARAVEYYNDLRFFEISQDSPTYHRRKLIEYVLFDKQSFQDFIDYSFSEKLKNSPFLEPTLISDQRVNPVEVSLLESESFERLQSVGHRLFTTFDFLLQGSSFRIVPVFSKTGEQQYRLILENVKNSSYAYFLKLQTGSLKFPRFLKGEKAGKESFLKHSFLNSVFYETTQSFSVSLETVSFSAEQLPYVEIQPGVYLSSVLQKFGLSWSDIGEIISEMKRLGDNPNSVSVGQKVYYSSSSSRMVGLERRSGYLLFTEKSGKFSGQMSSSSEVESLFSGKTSLGSLPSRKGSFESSVSPSSSVSSSSENPFVRKESVVSENSVLEPSRGVLETSSVVGTVSSSETLQPPQTVYPLSPEPVRPSWARSEETQVQKSSLTVIPMVYPEGSSSGTELNTGKIFLEQTKVPVFVQFSVLKSSVDSWVEMNRLRTTLPSRFFQGIVLYTEPTFSGEWRVAATGSYSPEDFESLCRAFATYGEECRVMVRRKS